LYRRVLGSRFDALPARVRDLHDLRCPSIWVGVAGVERGRSIVSRLAAFVSGLPPEGPDQPLRVSFEPAGTGESWVRQFGSASFRSVQYERGGFLLERVGLTTFVFTALASADGLALRLDGFRVLGIPFPRLL